MRSTERVAYMYRDLCNVYVQRTACYARIQCTPRITRTSCIHLFASTARMACTARSALAQVEIFPHLRDPIYTQDPTHHSSHTALPDEHCSGRQTPPIAERSPSHRHCTQHTQCTRQMRSVGLAAQPRRHHRPLRFTQQKIN